MRAFDAAAVDYLLKPYSAERFRASLERVRTRLREAKPVPSVPKDLKLASRAPGDHAERMVAETADDFEPGIGARSPAIHSPAQVLSGERGENCAHRRKH